MIIVSCCDQEGGIFTIDENTLAVQKVVDTETRGIDIDKGELFACNKGGLQVYDLDFNLLRSTSKPNDWHGLRVIDNAVNAVSATEDTLYIFSKDLTLEGKATLREGTGQGRNHINDLFYANGALYYSMFSDMVKESYKLGPGCIKKTNNGAGPVITSLQEPHTVYIYESELYYCNSAKGTFHKGVETIIDTDSYTRGIEITDSHYWVGCSKDRHNRGNNGPCGVIRCNRKNRLDTVFIPLPAQNVYGLARGEQ